MVMSLVLRVSRIHGVLPWTLKGTSMLQPMVLTPSKVFTPDGTYVRSYGDVKSPSGIAIDEEGYSFVCENRGNCLSIFDPQGTKIHTVGNLTNPYGVALDPISGSLYVAYGGANTVLKYSV